MDGEEWIGLLFLFGVVLVAVFFFIYSFAAIDFAVSEGTFRGKVIDAEYTGLIWKNYVFHVQRTYNETFPFTICHDTPNAEQLFQKVKDAQAQGKEVVVSYKDRFMYFKWECNGSATPITGIEVGQ